LFQIRNGGKTLVTMKWMILSFRCSLNSAVTVAGAALGIFSLFILCAIPLSAQAKPVCEKLKDLQLTDTAIISADSVAAGPFALPPGSPAPSIDVTAFCRVKGQIKPTSDSNITLEVWLPASGWNGKFEQLGNGGLAGSINLFLVAAEMKKGFATAATDDGHQGIPVDASWATGHPEKVKDFGYRAVHETSLKAKQIIAAFYQKSPSYSYFNGCSEGGREAMMEAQRYPEDFNGILAGAAALEWTKLMFAFAWNAQALNNPVSFIPDTKRKAVREAALAACGTQDGVRDDFIKDPLRCHFDPSALACKGADSDSCLTAEQITALKKIYAGPSDSTGQQISPGYEPGAEDTAGIPGISFASYVFGASPGASLDAIFSSAFFGGFVFGKPGWKFSDLNFDKDIATTEDKVGSVLNANNSDLTAFRARGGKLLQYHGWNDGSPSPLHSVNYYENVMGKMGGFGKTKDFYRLFMAPGVMHCGSGPGPNLFGNMLDFGAANDPERNVFTALEKWTEEGVAPDKVIATKYQDDNPAKGVEMTRPLCPYPQQAKWSGKGATSNAQNWSCQVPAGKR
jgi:hypothetical protein